MGARDGTQIDRMQAGQVPHVQDYLYSFSIDYFSIYLLIYFGLGAIPSSSQLTPGAVLRLWSQAPNEFPGSDG